MRRNRTTIIVVLSVTAILAVLLVRIRKSEVDAAAKLNDGISRLKANKSSIKEVKDWLNRNGYAYKETQSESGWFLGGTIDASFFRDTSVLFTIKFDTNGVVDDYSVGEFSKASF